MLAAEPSRSFEAGSVGDFSVDEAGESDIGLPAVHESKWFDTPQACF